MAYTYSPLASYTVGSGGIAAITFSNIPQNYTDLLIKLSLRDLTSSNWNSTVITFNGSTTNYTQRMVYQADGTVASANAASLGYLYSVGANATANTFANSDMYIPNYAGSTNKSVSIDSVTENNATQVVLNLTAGLWSNTTAINQITITKGTQNFAQYSTAYLYGIRVEY